MPLLKLLHTKARLAVCLVTLILPLAGCYDHVHAALPTQKACVAERDIALQSHFMIWHMCMDEK